jgi:hypothetical protein
MSDIEWSDKSLMDGLDGLLKDALSYMEGSAERLNQEGKFIYKTQMKGNGRLYTAGKRNLGNEWFTEDNKKWYITNKWKVPNSVYSAKNFVKNKKKSIEHAMRVDIGTAKQKELDGAIDFAVSNF